MRAKSRGQRTEDRIIGWEAGGQINIKEEINKLKDKGMSNIYLKKGYEIINESCF